MSSRMPTPEEFMRNSLKMRAEYEAKCREAGLKIPARRVASTSASPAIEIKSRRERALAFCHRVLSRPPMTTPARKPTIGEMGGLSPKGHANLDHWRAVAENLHSRFSRMR